MTKRKKRHKRAKPDRTKHRREKKRNRPRIPPRVPFAAPIDYEDGTLTMEGGPPGGFGRDMLGKRLKMESGREVKITKVGGATASFVWVDEYAHGFNRPVMSLHPDKKDWEEKKIGDDIVRRREEQLHRLGYTEVWGFEDDERQLRAAGLTVAYLLRRVFVHKSSADEFQTLQKMIDPILPRRDPYGHLVRSGRFSTRDQAKRWAYAQMYGGKMHAAAQQAQQLHTALAKAFALPKSVLQGLAPSSLSLGTTAARALAEYNRKDVMMTQKLREMGVDVKGKEQ